MAQHRWKLSLQFKAEAMQFVLQTGHPMTRIAQELELGKGTLHNCLKAWKLNSPEPLEALSPMERPVVAEVKTKIRRLQMENKFLEERRPSSPRRNPS